MTFLSLAHLTRLHLSPEELVRQSAAAGFDAVGLRVYSAETGALCYPLPNAGPEHRNLRSVLRQEGIRVNEVEFVPLIPDLAPVSLAGMLESAAELGAASLLCCGDDPDNARLVANFAAICELAKPFGIRVDLEFMRWRQISNLRKAVAVIKAAGQPNSGVMLDVLHLFRTEGSFDELPGAIDCIHAVQLCDGPLQMPPEQEIISEGRERRQVPGAGEFPLMEILKTVSPKVSLSVEVPNVMNTSDDYFHKINDETRRILKTVRVCEGV